MTRDAIFLVAAKVSFSCGKKTTLATPVNINDFPPKMLSSRSGPFRNSNTLTSIQSEHNENHSNFDISLSEKKKNRFKVKSFHKKSVKNRNEFL
jgi:Tfp pilus assembly pilus retraction ATPase PilT